GESDTYKDSDHEYVLLDDDFNYSHSDTQSEISSTTTKTSNYLENNNTDFPFTEAISNFIKAYTDSEQNNFDEANIDWLNSEIDYTSETGSINSCIIDLDNEKELDLDISNCGKISEFSQQCVILDIKNGTIQR
ncbi:22953_t:CDS:1, partial [Racocetra persica]